jgi:hypothetical protein
MGFLRRAGESMVIFDPARNGGNDVYERARSRAADTFDKSRRRRRACRLDHRSFESPDKLRRA